MEKNNIGPNAELEECQKQRDEYLNNWKREAANFINYKKEESERLANALQYSTEHLALKMIEILDNFRLAETEMPKELAEDKWTQGVLKIKSQIEEFLKSMGVEEIVKDDNCFNPETDEAIEITELREDDSSGKILRVIEEVVKGYKINGKVIRARKVKVSK